jgi:hypothetical protein
MWGQCDSSPYRFSTVTEKADQGKVQRRSGNNQKGLLTGGLKPARPNAW